MYNWCKSENAFFRSDDSEGMGVSYKKCKIISANSSGNADGPGLGMGGYGPWGGTGRIGRPIGRLEPRISRQDHEYADELADQKTELADRKTNMQTN